MVTEYHYPFLIFQTLNFDISKTESIKRTFWFSKPVTAKYVSIVTLKAMVSALTCLKFELLGCKPSGKKY
jgi:hypothetical protein